MRYKITTAGGAKLITTFQNDGVTEFSKEAWGYVAEKRVREELIGEAINYIYEQGFTLAQIKTFLQTNRNQLIDYEKGISADLLTAISTNVTLTAAQKTALTNILTI